MNKNQILIVEDEAIIAADLQIKLEQIGYEVVGIASQGLEAVQMAQELNPDLILMDIQLEGTLDGIQAAEKLHSQRDIPVIFLTAHSDQTTLARAKLGGTFGYILKPFDDRELSTQIELALYKHQAESRLREQRELLRVTLSSIGEAVIATDAKCRVTFINPVAASLTGRAMDQATGKPLQDVFQVVDEHTGQYIQDPMKAVLETGKIVKLSNHYMLIGADGSKVPVNMSGAPIRDKEGGTRGVVLVFRDISPQRRAEAEKDVIIADLKEAMGKIRTLSGLLPICSACKKIRDDQGYWNQIEAYIRERSEAEFTHSLCPACAKELYPNFNIDESDLE